MEGFHLEKIWDPVTRLWHWILVLAVSLGWSFGKFMSFDTIQWHFYIGYLILGLMVFRYLWGFAGPTPVRYRAIIPTPTALLTYLRHMGRRAPSGSPGHNPVGSLSVIAMLVVIGAQALSGLFIESDDFFEYGPLAGYVSEAMVNRLQRRCHPGSGYTARQRNSVLSGLEKRKPDQTDDHRLEMGKTHRHNA